MTIAERTLTMNVEELPGFTAARKFTRHRDAPSPVLKTCVRLA
jgi:hypothetical protein